MDPPKYQSNRAGADYGVTLLLHAAQQDYMCTSIMAGFRITVHNSSEQPFPDTSGIYIVPGTNNYIELKRVVFWPKKT